MSLIYMKLSNAQGSVTEKHHQGWIAVDRYHFSVGRYTDMQTGNVQNRISGSPTFGELEIIKPADKSSISLLDILLQGKAVPECQLDVCHGGNGDQIYAQYVLNHVMVSHYEEGSDGLTGHNKELITLAYTEIQRKFIPYDASNKAGSPFITGYRLSEIRRM